MEPTETISLQTTEELAAFFNVSARTIRTWHRHGRLRAVRIGRELRFRKADVDDAIRAYSNREPGEAA